MTKRSEFRPNLKIFGVQKTDPGWIYLVENQDFLKVGKTNNPVRRLEREAKTWLPDLTIVGAKPFWNVLRVERLIHEALSRYWYSREWYKICDKDEHDFVVNGFWNFTTRIVT